VYSCNFDYGSICSWAHPRTAPMKWLVRTDSTQTPRTGANKDHTSGKGRYAYIETTSSSSSNLSPGERAVITSPIVTAGPSCPLTMSLYYNMYGQDIGTLLIQVIHLQPPTVWNLTGQQHSDGNTWTRAEFQLPDALIGKRFQFLVMGIRGDGPYGDICIDDITITQSCSEVRQIRSTADFGLEGEVRQIRSSADFGLEGEVRQFSSTADCGLEGEVRQFDLLQIWVLKAKFVSLVLLQILVLKAKFVRLH
ncbi:MAM domain-containing glycosylphosphatidylinositol anchor protein 1, partial [Elysia marginata]